MAINFKTWKDGYIDEYPEFSKIADEQIKIFWPWDEIKVAKDKQDLLINMDEMERHGVLTTLKAFTKYELFVGEEHWGNRIAKSYPHLGVKRMASAFSHVELNSHAPFYDQINKELGVSNFKFYTAYLDDPDLVNRMKFIDEALSSEDDEFSTAVFSIVEGSILYSNFAYLKYFQSKGKNRIQNIVRGLNMSTRDENLHSVGGAAIVKQALSEMELTSHETKNLHDKIKDAADIILQHEIALLRKTGEKGWPEGLTELQLVNFNKSRLNICLQQLGIEKIYEVKYNPIADWFYTGINNYQMNDFFQGVGREYQRDWAKESFTWKKT